MANYEGMILDLINTSQRQLLARSMILGGVPSASGGAGGPPGGFVGYLPQKRVAYDTDEAAFIDTPVSGMSLYDNLGHIRYRLDALESGIGASTFLDLTDTPTSYSGEAGKFVVVDNTETGLVFTSGSGGNTTTTGSIYDIPTASTDGNLYLPNDAVHILRDNGSSWDSWGPVFKMTPPPDTGWTTINSSGSTIAIGYNVVYIGGNAYATEKIHALVRTLPSRPYDIICAVQCMTHGVNYNKVGIGWRQSSDGKYVTFGKVGLNTLNSQKYTNTTTLDSDYISVDISGSGLLWLKLHEDADGGNRTVSWSLDKIHWIQEHSVSRTDWLTANQFVLFANAVNSTYPVGITLLSYEEVAL